MPVASKVQSMSSARVSAQTQTAQPGPPPKVLRATRA